MGIDANLPSIDRLDALTREELEVLLEKVRSMKFELMKYEFKVLSKLKLRAT